MFKSCQRGEICLKVAREEKYIIGHELQVEVKVTHTLDWTLPAKQKQKVPLTCFICLCSSDQCFFRLNVQCALTNERSNNKQMFHCLTLAKKPSQKKSTTLSSKIEKSQNKKVSKSICATGFPPIGLTYSFFKSTCWVSSPPPPSPPSGQCLNE